MNSILAVIQKAEQARPILRYSAAMADRLGMNLALVVKPSQGHVTELHILDKAKSMQETIFHFAGARKADLVAVLRENKTFFERLFTKSSTKGFIDRPDRPVLIYSASGWKEGS